MAAMATQIAASSSSGFSSKTKYRFDVLHSFRGEDTPQSPLLNCLPLRGCCRPGINAFIDDKKLGKGEEISPTLLKATERSRISIIVFSKNYATSTWCLKELAHIIWCKKQKAHLVMPIFYKVDLMDVQYQRNSFVDAMAALEDRFRNDLKKVRKWRSALSEAASLSLAWLFQDGLDLSRNDFVCLPKCAQLRWLNVSDCKRLRDIPELPSKLRDINAENCASLTEEALDSLYSLAKKEFPKLPVTRPTISTSFHDWFNYCCEGGILCFRACRNLPPVALALQLAKANTSEPHSCTVSMSINNSCRFGELLC